MQKKQSMAKLIGRIKSLERAVELQSNQNQKMKKD